MRPHAAADRPTALHRAAHLQGIQFVKQLERLDEPAKQRAEVAAWLRDFEGAAEQYAQMDRPDLAVDLQVGGAGACPSSNCC